VSGNREDNTLGTRVLKTWKSDKWQDSTSKVGKRKDDRWCVLSSGGVKPCGPFRGSEIEGWRALHLDLRNREVQNLDEVRSLLKSQPLSSA
jgi:hypothetical protein